MVMVVDISVMVVEAMAFTCDGSSSARDGGDSGGGGAWEMKSVGDFISKCWRRSEAKAIVEVLIEVVMILVKEV